MPDRKTDNKEQHTWRSWKPSPFLPWQRIAVSQEGTDTVPQWFNSGFNTVVWHRNLTLACFSVGSYQHLGNTWSIWGRSAVSEEHLLDLRPKPQNHCPWEVKTALFFTTSTHYVSNGSKIQLPSVPSENYSRDWCPPGGGVSVISLSFLSLLTFFFLFKEDEQWLNCFTTICMHSFVAHFYGHEEAFWHP